MNQRLENSSIPIEKTYKIKDDHSLNLTPNVKVLGWGPGTECELTINVADESVTVRRVKDDKEATNT